MRMPRASTGSEGVQTIMKNATLFSGSRPAAAMLIAAASTTVFGASADAKPDTNQQKSEHSIGSDSNTNRGFTDCDGNGIDDTIDFETDFGNRTLATIFPWVDCYGFVANSIGSDFDTEVAVFDEQGTLLFQNDDIVPGNLQSEIREFFLPAGTYYVGFAGFNTEFDDGPSLSFDGCRAAGTLRYRVESGFGSTTVGEEPLLSGRSRWFEFSVTPYTNTEDTNQDGVCDNEPIRDDIANATDLGIIANPDQSITFDTTGSDFSNEIGVFTDSSAFALLIDDAENPSGTGTQLTVSLPAGDYLFGILPNPSQFASGPTVNFESTLGAPGGAAALAISSPIRTLSLAGSVADYRSRWYRFTVAPDVGPDCDFDGVLDADELDCNSDGIPDDCQIFQNLLLGGVAGTSDAPIEINTFGSNFDTEIAVWDYTTGELLALNDDFDGANNRQSQIVRTYEPGEYLLAISGFNTQFSDFSPDFQFGGITVNANGCAASGTATVTIGENTGSGLGIGSGRVQLVPFTVLPGAQPCNAADLATPFEVLDLADINAFIDSFTNQLPAGDLDTDGVWDLTDIGLFITAFTGGCP